MKGVVDLDEFCRSSTLLDHGQRLDFLRQGQRGDHEFRHGTEALSVSKSLAEWSGGAQGGLIDHVIVVNEDHLRRVLHDYIAYYNAERVHTVLGDSPNGRPIETRPSTDVKAVGLPRVGGLHHRHIWKTAA
jgi:hypothetical protein